MDWSFLSRFWRRLRRTAHKLMLSARKVWRMLSEKTAALPRRRLALLLVFLAFLGLTVVGYPRRPFRNESPPQLVFDPDEVFLPENIFTDESTVAQEEKKEEERAVLQQLQEDLAELRREIQNRKTAEETVVTVEKPVLPAFGRPVQGRLLRTTGWYRQGNEWRYHSGVDLTLPAGRNVLASAAGRVSEVRVDPIFGGVVVIDHGSGWSSLYGHVSSISITPGREVEKGTVLGKSSLTTCGPEPGIHFALYYQGNPVDPLSVIPGLSD